MSKVPAVRPKHALFPASTRRMAAAVFSLAVVATLSGAGCVNQVMKSEHSQELLKNDEFDQAIKVQAIGHTSEKATPTPTPVAVVAASTPAPVSKAEARKPRRKKRKHDAHSEVAAVAEPPPVTAPPIEVPVVHEPAMEDGEGFHARRPEVDPYRVGEKVVLDMSYFGVSAGDIAIEVRPFVKVNGRKSYNFVGTAVSTSVFAVFYAVDDWFETFVDYENMTPYSYALHVKETKQLRETRAIFDWTHNHATWWDKKIDAEHKVEEKKKDWAVPPFSQNVFSVSYYLRAFQLKVGKKLAFRVAHENENLIVTAEVIRREHITTPAGEFDTVVVKPKIELDGVFKSVGEFYLWLTDDDRKFIVRIESKIKIGTIVGVAKRIENGQDANPQ